MQLIVTCAGCGAKYRGESGPKKFRCAACSNLFTFPDQPKSASTGTILCSNCWTETVPTEKLKTCGFCSQRVSPRYGGLAAEDKQVKVKQTTVRNDPNLVKAVTRSGPSSGEMPVGGGSSPEIPQNQFTSNEWKELGTDHKPDMPDPKKTQAFELMAELKKEIEPEMQSVVESILKSQQVHLQRQESDDASGENNMAPHESQQFAGKPESSGIHGGDVEPHEGQGRQSGLLAQAHPERQTKDPAAGEHAELQARIADLEAQLAQEKSLREASARNDAVGELQAKVAELSSLVAADKRAKDQLLQDRVQLEELWRERDAKVSELSARLNSDAATRAALAIERDELREYKREHEGRTADLEGRLGSERQSKENLQRDRDQLALACKELEAKVADLSTRMASDRDSRETAFRAQNELAETRHELEARVADLDTRLQNEKKSKEALIKERDLLSDGHRELQARIADLDSRLHSEREAKDAVSRKHDEHLNAKNELDAKVADLESRLHSERDAKESAHAERASLLEVRKELEAKTADLSRRHANEREAKERVVKDHNDLANEHRELSAKIADFKTRLKAEQDIKENVRKERDAALLRADTAESRVEKSEAETARLRKGIHAQLDKFAAEYNAILAKLAEKTAELAAHSAATRKRLDEAAQHHGDKVEAGAAELKSKLEHESVEIGARLKKLMQEHDSRESARLNVQSGSHPPLPSSGVLSVTGSSANSLATPAPVQSSGSGRLQVAAQKPASPNEGSGSLRAMASAPAQESAPPPEAPPAPVPNANASSGSRNPVVTESAPPTDPGQDKSSGTFWAKVFKRPATKI